MVGFLCNECGKSFQDEIGLVLHETRTHDNRTFPCEKCSEKNPDHLYSLTNHRRTTVKPYIL